jgi:O-acetyl-ADP-ribose deacetylase (regulator of RNase III)
MEEIVGKVGKTSLRLVQGDITRQATDVIVNAANSGLMGGGGVDGAIHRAGGPSILEECKQIRQAHGRCPAGKAVITGAGNLKARWVVHAVGPIWRDGMVGEPEILAGAYRTSLELAFEAGARSVSFPSISTGAYGYPVNQAAAVALTELKHFLEANPDKFDELCLVLFDAASYDAYKAAAGLLIK